MRVNRATVTLSNLFVSYDQASQSMHAAVVCVFSQWTPFPLTSSKNLPGQLVYGRFCLL